MPLDPATLPPCLREFTLDQIHAKIEGLADDWFSPTLSPMGLCRTHDIGLVQLRAITALPLFREILADIRFIQDERRADIQQRARDHALDRLSYLAHQTPTSAASCKEIRLATKALLELTAPPSPTTPTTPTSPGGTGVPPVSPPPSSQPMTPPMQSAAPSPSTHDGPSNSKDAVPTAHHNHTPNEPNSDDETACGRTQAPVSSEFIQPQPRILTPDLLSPDPLTEPSAAQKWIPSLPTHAPS